jgi:spoIIIJ-associated protein
VTSEINTPEEITGRTAECLRRIIAEGGFTAEVAVISTEGSDISLDVTGPDAGALVGPHGHTLDAIQYLLTLIVNKRRDDRLRIWVDAAGYRARRAETLAKFANTLADEVAASGQEAITDPLNPMERRIIHTALVERTDVQTYSEGEEPHRYVVVSPKAA